MATKPTMTAVPVRANSAQVSTTYGNGTAGFTTRGANVGDYASVQFEGTFANVAGGATTLTIKVQGNDQAAGLTDANWADQAKVDPGTGNVTVDEITVPLATMSTKFGFRLNTEAMSCCRLCAKTDVGTCDLTLRAVADTDREATLDLSFSST